MERAVGSVAGMSCRAAALPHGVPCAAGSKCRPQRRRHARSIGGQTVGLASAGQRRQRDWSRALIMRTSGCDCCTLRRFFVRPAQHELRRADNVSTRVRYFEVSMLFARPTFVRARSLFCSLALVLAVSDLSACNPSCPKGSTLRDNVCRTSANHSGAGQSADETDSGGTRGGRSGGGSSDAGSLENAASANAGKGAVEQPPKTAAGASGDAADGGTNCSARQELCDNADNDCDGKIDEDVAPRSCGKYSMSPCKLGTLACHAGVWDDEATKCEGQVLPGVEVCDEAQVDENCDGIPNEGCKCTEGQVMPCGNGNAPCKMGLSKCVDGTFSAVCENEVKGGPELCDGIDNDCDGTPDNGGDALCSDGEHCAGAQKCVECRGDGDCRGSTDACKVSYCDLASHVCSIRNQPDNIDCSTSAETAVCKSGTCTASARCGDGVTDSSNQEECDDGNRNNNDECLNSCKKATCGDGVLNQALIPGSSKPVEECDISAGRGDAFSCDMATCKPAYILTPCASGKDCGGGFCDQGKGCRHACATPSPSEKKTSSEYECKLPNGRVGFCDQWCFLRCDVGGTTCPSGTECTVQFGFMPLCTFL